MAIRNADIAAAFEEIADLLDMERANPFRIRAYRRAARVLARWPEQMADRMAAGRSFDELPGVGADLAGKIGEMLASGHCSTLEQLRARFPRGITALLGIPGIGPRRAQALHQALGVHSPRQVLEAARAGRIREIPGFGPAIERRIAVAAAGHAEGAHRWPLAQATPHVEALLACLRDVAGVDTVIACGSYRRRRETVGDLDLLVAATDGRAVVKRFVGFEATGKVLEQGSTRARIVLTAGLQVDLRVMPPASLGAALVYFTGSMPHNIALRRIAKTRGLRINEYGVFRGRRRLAGDTEASVYAAIDLPWIPPELREDRGEIEAAQARRLPRLVEHADLRGDLHAHTDASDGSDSLEAMARAARAAGLEYLAITDHTHGLAIAHGLDAKRLHAQADAIDRLNRRLRGITLLKGAEVEILEDGRLDLPDELLARLDLVVGAVHRALDLPRNRQTDRILRAMDHPRFGMLAHPNGRLLGRRAPCDIDIGRIIHRARERGCVLELNAQPDRLDLFDSQCRQAKEAGVAIAVTSDAHAVADFGHLPLGIDQARRGWLEAGDVVNTLPLPALRERLAAAAGGRPATA